MKTVLAIAAALVLGISVQGHAAATASGGAAAMLQRLEDQLVALELREDPLLGYTFDIGMVDHRHWPDSSPRSVRGYERESDALLASLGALDTTRLDDADRAIYATMREHLESNQQLRVCRNELWAVNQMSGWHLTLATAAREQPVSTAEERAWAIERWSALPTMIDQEIANARTGIEQGYSSPKSVVRRVIGQMNALIEDTSSLVGPATRSNDPAFKRRFNRIIVGPAKAALRRYRDFLQNDYLPRARDALGVSANPNGVACYRAFLRSYTTLQRSPEEVFALGQQTVAANAERAREFGRAAFGTDNLPQIAARIPNAADNKFHSEEEFVSFARQMETRATNMSARYFYSMPRQPLVVEPVEAYARTEGGGTSSYEPQADQSRPAIFHIASTRWDRETRSGAEILAVHEGYPGHHLQIALSNGGPSSTPVMRMLINSAYVEGWARYAEALSEEAGIYQTRYAPISRRLWPARGMVVDPGIHVMGWTREQALAFMRESGRQLGPDGDAMVDRIAIQPGQLTAYDSGGLEIFALRHEAEQALGDRFDIREFHQSILAQGSVPLGTLRTNIEAWIAEARAARR